MTFAANSSATPLNKKNEAARDVSLLVLLAALRVLTRTSGILQIESPYHRWSFLIQKGIFIAEEEGSFTTAFARKLRLQAVQPPTPPDPDDRSDSARALDQCASYKLARQAERTAPEATARALRALLEEALLAIYLEDKFSFRWQPLSAIANLSFPAWQLSQLEEKIRTEANQWQNLSRLQHPYQTLELIHPSALRRRVGEQNFATLMEVTSEPRRLTEIADRLARSRLSSAQFFDQLAQAFIVRVHPLPERVETESQTESERDIPEVVIIDDSPVLLTQFQNLLQRWGYRVRCFNRSEVALAALSAGDAPPPAAIFLDINMPGMSGFETIKQIRRQSQLGEVPLVMITAEKNVANQWRAQWANCEFVAKPHTQEEVSDFQRDVRQLLQTLAPIAIDG